MSTTGVLFQYEIRFVAVWDSAYLFLAKSHLEKLFEKVDLVKWQYNKIQAKSLFDYELLVEKWWTFLMILIVKSWNKHDKSQLIINITEHLK